MVDEKFFRHLAIAAARAADDKKGDDILLLYTSPLSTVADYILIVTGTSSPHLNALDGDIRTSLKTLGMFATHRDGRTSDTWRVLDYGGLLIHLMHGSAREFYSLEKIFIGARKVAWAAPSARPAKAPVNDKPVKRPTVKMKAAKKKPGKKAPGRKRHA